MTVAVPDSWLEFAAIVSDATEEESAALLAAEEAGKRRLVFMLRAHSRLNRLRRARERARLARVAKGDVP